MNTWPSIPTAFYAQALRWQSRPLVYGKRMHHWRPLTWSQVALRASALASGLLSLDLQEGARVAIWAPSSPEWLLSDLGILTTGAVTVPIYESCSRDELIYILRDAECEGLFVAGQDRLDLVRSLSAYLPKLRWVITMDGREVSAHLTPASVNVSFLLRDLGEPDHSERDSLVQVLRLEHLEELGEEIEGYLSLVEARRDQITRASVATLQYTSGTTGEPKGVILTHGNLLSNCEGAIEAVPVGPSDVLLSFLPLSHAFERLAGCYMPLLFGGARLYFSEGLGHLIRSMSEVRPTIVTGIPRIYEKIYARFRGVRGPQGYAQRALLALALRGEQASSEAQEQGRDTPLWVLKQRELNQSLLFKELRSRLGGRLRFMVSGGAPLSERVAEFFSAAGILILEGYGLSEASPVLSVNRPGAYRFGSVGRPLFNVQLTCAEDGELLAKGPNITQGYHNKPNETAQLFTDDGWLKTGDIGQIDPAGFVQITDRKKDLFKTSNGKLIAPQFIERALHTSPYIQQAYVVGDHRPYCVALIHPSTTELTLWGEREGVTLTGNLNDWVKYPEVIALIEAEVRKINKALARHEQLKTFSLCGESFERFNTASLKLKRRAVAEAYAHEVEELYLHGRAI